MPKPKPEQTILRAAPELLEKLRTAAKARGVSFNREINDRLARSLDSEPIGRPSHRGSLSGILRLVAEAMQIAGESGVFHLTKSWEAARQCDWVDEPYACAEAIEAAARVLESIRPKGELKVPAPPINSERAGAKWAAMHVLNEAASGVPSYVTPETKARALTLHVAAGHLAERIANFLRRQK